MDKDALREGESCILWWVGEIKSKQRGGEKRRMKVCGVVKQSGGDPVAVQDERCETAT